MANDLDDFEEYIFAPRSEFEDLQKRVERIEGEDTRHVDTTDDMLVRMVQERILREPARDPLGDQNLDTTASDRRTLQEFERIWPEIRENHYAEGEAARRIAALTPSDAAYLVSEFRRRERRGR